MFIKALSTIGLTLSLAGCVTGQGTTDAGGRSISLESHGNFQPQESRFNTFTFLKPSREYVTESEERDNGQGWNEDVKWENERYFFAIQYINTAWFSTRTEARMLEVEQFKRLANAYQIADLNFVQIDQVSPRVKGWIASNGKCSAGLFAKRFKGLSPYDNDRGASDAVVSFAGCSQFAASVEEIMQGIDLMTDEEEAKLAVTYAEIGTLNEPASARTGITEELSVLTGSWDGVSESLSGDVRKKGAAQIEFSFTIPETGADCVGTAVTSSMSDLTGTWKLSCDDGSSADGIWTNRETQPFIASGSDSKKRPVSFKLQS
ncbi:MAG: hypothetical protein RIG26_00790 [Thalassospira sp.]|uniref:hypothetical protein n=1 Tax=Thalassospira sp. TaxID=1912094 RepID=UPI0032EC5E21